jgi:2-dehydropantoate 2-reductase
VRDQVPHLAADALAGRVELDLGAERAQLAREALRDAALALRETVDLNEREQIVAQAVRLDHARSMKYRARVAQRETGGALVVAGAGALGSVFGGLLAHAGFRVILVGRGAHMAAIARDGLRIEGLFGDHVVHGLATVSDVGQLDGTFDTVLLTVKSYDTAAMVGAMAPHLAPDGLLISLQNGLGNVEQAEDVLGRARVVGARVIFGAELLAPGHVRVTVIAAPVLVGSPDPHDAVRAALARTWARRFADAGIPSEPTDNLLGELWAKVFYNAALNPLGALLRVPYGHLPDDPDTRALMDRLIDEAFAVARASGVTLRWPDAAGVPATHTDRLAGLLWAKVFYNAALNPLGALLGTHYGALPESPESRAIMDAAIDEAFSVALAESVDLPWRDADQYRQEFYGRLVPSTYDHRSSMLQDVERRRRTEIDAINGAVWRRGSAHGSRTPVNETLTRLIHLVECGASH